MLASIVEIFCEIDDYCKEFFQGINQKFLPNPARQRKKPGRLCLSEIMTITILFHLSHYRKFKSFYLESVGPYLHTYFSSLVSYNRFVELQQSVIVPLASYLLSKHGEETGL
ncbi:hypothetical protein [Candidatus Rickettsiella viridis]|uniref:hypothetical protein n=1 Tax=Candidatus Rickettsiella viridis TaxID=676208 RepID=UPI000F8244CB|nr:hypothetical protein [Candidatus Rickettsiella viridis]